MEEEKKVKTEAEEKAEAEAKAKAEADSKAQETHIDYKALLEEEKKRRENLEASIRRHKEKANREEAETLDVEEDSTEKIRAVLREELDEFKTSFMAQTRAEEIKQAIQKVSSTPEEAQLIQYHYDNSIRLTGDIGVDVHRARTLANQRFVQNQLEEAKATIVSKDTKSSGSPTGRKSGGEEEETLPTLTSVDLQTINVLREKYVLSNTAIRKILKGERLDALLEQGIVKKR